MDDNDFHEFDPYDLLVKISGLLNEMAKRHNDLVDDYIQTQKIIRNLIKKVERLEKEKK